MLQGEVLHLGLEVVQTQTMRQRGIEIKSIGSKAVSVLFRKVFQNPHQLEPFCQFDQDHPDIGHHCQDHGTECFGLLTGVFDTDG